ELVHRYPTAALLAKASAADLDDVPYLPQARIEPLLEHARASIASLADEAIAELVREQVRQLRDTGARQKRLETLLVSAYRASPRTPPTYTPSAAWAPAPPLCSPLSSSTSTASRCPASSSPTSAPCPSKRPAASIATASRAGRSATS